MSKSNIEHFIPLYQQDKSFHQEHLTGLAYGLENLNSEKIDPQTFKSKYEYVDALSDQSLRENKLIF